MDKKLKAPKKLFEDRRLKSSKKLNCQEIENNTHQEVSKKVISPKILFNENNEVIDFGGETVNLSEEYIGKDNDQKNQVEELIFNLSEDVSNLKKNIRETQRYDTEINFIKKYIKKLEREISRNEKFDPSNIYEGLTHIRKQIQQVRSEIPTIPEPISYENEFDELKNSINRISESIPVVPEIKYYDKEIYDLLESIDDIKEQIDNFPEVKYYDHQIDSVEKRIVDIKNSIQSIPEIKYYDDDISILEEKIKEVQFSIPTVPEVRYYEKEISDLESKFCFLSNTIDNLPELPEVKYYDEDVSKLNEQLNKLKEEIISLPEPKYYDDEIKKIHEQINSVKKSIPKPQIIPEIKYYDEEINVLQSDISILSKRISDIKIPDTKIYTDRLDNFYKEFQNKSYEVHQKLNNLQGLFEKLNDIQNEQILKGEEFEQKLNESITAEPPETNTPDPLSPLVKEFVTFKELSEHYRLFINRIQQQLSTIGGGNEITTLKMLDDVVGISTNGSAYDGKYLRYNHSTQTFSAEPIIVGDGELSGTLTGLFDTDITNLQDGYLMVYNASSSKFIFVDPRNYFGINADFNPDLLIDDYGTYN